MTKRITAMAAAVVTAATVAGATGCAVTVQNVPMPKPGIGAPGYTIRASFRDALNLPDRAHVKIGGSDIGVVTKISSKDFVADVEMLIRADIQLPHGTTVELRQATPLGDMFVAMTLPSVAEAGPPLRAGNSIGLEQTATGASVEQLMMSVSMLVNGGGINQAARITSEMNSMFVGRGPQLAHLITEMTAVISALNQRTGDIDNVLGGLNVLEGELARRKAELSQAADTFPGLVGLFTENNQRIVELLTKTSTTMAALEDFSDTTGDDFVSLFDSIQQLMSGFARSTELTATLEGLHQLTPRVLASMEGPTLAIAATVSYLSVGALTDPSGSRLPELADVPAFIGSFAQVLEKVFGRLTSPPQPAPTPQTDTPAQPQPEASEEGHR
ncbi:MCE family protein [Nocardia goodfellowii]|uniref:Virulence factor Mce-like protein n=1 Tax=Nocardia goodfellowii TaxID=882446 RepID=A0ABS4QMZ7_9NOCA|nr:MCE family protein [Nocardia goodfellowii]MBP2193080.1 virulence factor Mce-like protein [Nocardia goodfellowii]